MSINYSCFRKTNINHIIFILLALSLVLVFTGQKAFAQADGKPASADVFGDVKQLMKEGKFQEARKALMDYHAPKEEQQRVEGFIALTRYADPDWYPGDLSLLKKYSTYTIPLMTGLVAAPPPKKGEDRQKDWVNICRIKFMKALARMDEKKAFPVLEKALDDKDSRIRLGAVESLSKIKNPSVVKTLMKFLRTEHIPDYAAGNVEMQLRAGKQAQVIAIAAIAGFGDSSVVDQLKEEVNKTKSPDRVMAATILTGYRSVKFLKIYRDLLKDSDKNLQIYSASALKEMGNDEGLPVLKDLFENGSDMEKIRLIDTLGWWKNKDVAQFFIDYLKKQSEDNQIGFVPLSNLGKVPDTSDIPTPAALVYYKIMQKLIDWKAITPALLLNEIDKKEGNFRYISIEILGETLDKQAVEKLRKNLASKDTLLVYYSIWALGRIGDKNSIPSIEKLLANPDNHIKAAAAWSLAKMGNGKGLNIALKNLQSSDPALSATAMDTLYKLRMKETVQKIQEVIGGEFGFLKPEAFRLLGILKSLRYDDSTGKAMENGGATAFYGAEALFRTNGNPTKFAVDNRIPREQSFYGNGIYNSMDYARYALLYFSLKPEVFGEIRDASYGDITPLYRYGEFGRIEDQSPANPFVLAQKDEDKKEGAAQAKDEAENSEENIESTITAPSPAGELYPGTTVLLKEFRGRKSRVVLPDGREGWTFTAGLNLTENVIGKTKDRMQRDFGYRWDNDLLKILEEDYLKGIKFDVKYENPAGYEAAKLNKFALNMALGFAGITNPPETIWDDMTKEVYKGSKTIKTKNPFGEGEWVFQFDELGKPVGVKVE